MKPFRDNLVLWLCVVTLASFSGCVRKKPVTAVPQAPPPVAAAPQATPEPTPAEPAPAQASQTPTQGTPPPDRQPAQPAEAEEKPDAAKTKNGKPHPGRKTEARNTPPKTNVVKPDGESISPPGQISPGLSHAEIAQAQATTEQLLQSTEANLNGIKRQLSQDEQSIVTQIRDFMAQSRQATKENDLVRAHNLAVKANLLSDELVKRR